MQEDKFSKYKGKGITGLTNVGNSCYMNSCLQCLSHTYELNMFLDNTEYKDKLNDSDGALILVEWDNLRTMMWSQNCTVSPYGFVNALQKVAAINKQQMFTGHQQNDLQEFLMFLLERFHKAISRHVDMKVSGTVKNDKDAMAVECYKMMSNMYEKDYSEIIGLFYGIHVSTISAINDSDTLSMRAEPFFVLSLSLPDKTCDNINIYSCIDEFCKKERLDGDNEWFNEKTNTKQCVDKGVVFWSFPEILIVHLKRWDYSGNKDTRLVNIPLENVDLTNYVKGYNQQNFIYSLYGVCDHDGGSSGGHYTATIRTADDEWYRFNDASVSKIAPNAVIAASAYCLFFRKKNST